MQEKTSAFLATIDCNNRSRNFYDEWIRLIQNNGGDMRRIAFAIAVMMCAATAFADSARTQLSFFTSSLGYTESASTGSHWTGGAGVALSYAWSPHWAAEAAAEYQTSRGLRVVPVDALMQYRFPNSSRWTPYVQAGLRHVNARDERNSFQIGAGTSLRITPHFGLRFDVNHLMRSDGGVGDPINRGSIGVSWRF